MILSESLIRKFKKLAGLVLETSSQEKVDAFSKSDERVPYNKELMIQAIQQGREVGILFQSNNEKYKMPIAKYRIIYPVALGISKKGNPVIRAFHKMGQSEKVAIATGKRSAEVENTWRLLKISNIKSMWITGNFFRGPLEAYNSNGDKGMVNIEVQADFNKIKTYQDNLIANIKDKKEQEQKRKNIVQLFKQTGERPVEQPVKNTEDQNNKIK
jgi:hypothetical protein